ncbi:MAG: hypothetical protein GKR91_19765 [Pseudomonadales bacterium]|nr:hypothetical protein [Pseudomonadales bacterium]
MTLRLAMWSGPRNISTAMMRAWENRTDCVVVDEPFYACYLGSTGLEHPMRDEIMQVQSSAWEEVANQLSHGQEGVDIYYQKQMTHHMLKNIDLNWTKNLKHCFLIRDPFEVVNSYCEKMETISVEDIGIVRQWQLYQDISAITEQKIPVIDSAQVLKHPEKVLKAVCAQFSIPFSTRMLQWPPGRRESDGVWASHWYQVVERSTNFAPYKERIIKLTNEQQEVAEKSVEAYENMLDRSILLLN